MTTYSDLVRKRIAAMAARMIAGEVDHLEGCRAIMNMRGSLSEPERSDPELETMLVVDSELEDVPTGSTRALWAPEALAIKDQEKAKYLEEMREHLLRSCQALIAKWGPQA